MDSALALATAQLSGLIAAGATLLALFWRMGQETAIGDGSGFEPGNPRPDQRVDDLRDYLDSKFGSVDQRFETMQHQLDRRFDTVEGRIDAFDEEFGKLESRVNELHWERP